MFRKISKLKIFIKFNAKKTFKRLNRNICISSRTSKEQW